MKNIFYLIVLLCFVDLLEVKSDKSDDDEVLSQLNVDVKKINSRKWKVIRKKNIHFNNNDNNDYYYGGEDNSNNNNKDDADVFKLQWWGNGDFGKKYSSDFPGGKLFRSEDKINSIHRDIKEQQENEDEEELSSAPSRVLAPPFKYYSSSIHNLATENIEEYSTTTTEFYNTSNSLRIYEITSSNLSTPDSTYNNKNDNKNYGRSFMIEDPSKKLNSFDSLRSVILNRQQGNVQSNNYNNVDSYGKDLLTIDDNNNDDDDKLLNINRDSETRANRLLIKKSRSNKSFYLNRGNRKYQHAVDNDETRLVRDKTWSYPTDEKYTWKKIQRPINRDTNYRRFGTIVRVNTRTIGNDNTENSGVPGVPGLDYPIHHQHTHHRLQNTAARFLCPTDTGSHIYLADRPSRCQIFYVCFGGDIGVPMVCPNGTLFSQELQVCDWWYNVTC